MSTTHPCPCCQTDFTPSVSAETAGKDSMQNMFDCPHCQSVLKWEHNTIKVIHEADPETPKKLDIPNEKKLQTVSDSTIDNEQVSNEIITEPVVTDNPDIEQPLNESIAEPSNMEQPPGKSNTPTLEETTNTQFEFKEAHPEEELEQIHTNVSSAPESVEEKESPLPSSSQANFNLSSEEELVASSNNPESFSDVEDYGNSENASDKGFLHYDITIKGIDSTKIEQQVLGILEDPRFSWMAKEILSLQKDGILIIKKLNPVKAMCLISELSFLPVTLSWKQYMAITEPQVETATGEQPSEETADNSEEDIQE